MRNAVFLPNLYFIYFLENREKREKENFNKKEEKQTFVEAEIEACK